MQGLASAFQLAPELYIPPLLGASAASPARKQMDSAQDPHSLLSSVIFPVPLAMHLP